MFNVFTLINRLIPMLALIVLAGTVQAQTTTFAYQGQLTDGGSTANGVYDMQFKLFDTATVDTGMQQGATITNSTVQVTNGGFMVQLDFGAGVFTGPPRYLEIGIRPAGNLDPYTILAPRQAITSTPYAIRSSNAAVADDATQLGGIVASGFIQNTMMQQAGTNFNIGGNGTVGGTLSANAVDAATHYTIAGNRVLRTETGTGNLFVGFNTGEGNTSGTNNSFFGTSAGGLNETGIQNSYFGATAGQANQTGDSNSFFGFAAGALNTASGNSFFGARAGLASTTGCCNAFFGNDAGGSNQAGTFNAFFGFQAGANNTASDNSFFGAGAGISNTSGTFNAFFGSSAGRGNTTGDANAFFGTNSGSANTTGFQNSFFGVSSGSANTTGRFNSFFGFLTGNANTTGENNAYFGFQSGRNGTTGGFNTFIGSGAGTNNMTASFNTFVGNQAGSNNTTGNGNTFIGQRAGETSTTEHSNTFIGVLANGVAGITNATAIGANVVVTQSDSVILGNNASVGIGVSSPKAKLHVEGGNIYIGAPGQGIILKSPDGKVCLLLTIDNAGALALTPVSCQ